jgi:tape measure domain-containing protein
MARGVTGAVGQVTASFAQATVSAFDFRTRATMAFQALRGNGELEFSKLKALATEMGTSLGGTFSGIRALSAAGFGASEAEQMFKRLQDMKGIGLDQPTLDRLTLAMSQIKGAGVLQGDELRQIQETGINVGKIWESMAKSTGKTTAELKKMKEAGKLSADVAIAGIMDAMAGMAGGREAGELGREMGRKTAEGFGQRVSLLKSLFFDRLAEESTGGISGLLGTLSTAADDALGWLKTADAGAFFTEIGGGIKSMAADLGTAIKSDTARAYLVDVKELFLGAWHVGEGLWSVTKAFVQGWAGHKVDLEGTKGSLEGIAEFLKSEDAAVGMRRLGEAASYVGEAVIFLGTNFKVAADGARVMVMATNWLVETVRSLAASLYEGGANAARSLISGFVGGIFGGQGQVLAAASSVGTMALAALSGALDAHSPSRATERLGGFTTIGLARGMIAANDNSRRAAATVAGDVRTEMAAGLGVSAGAGASSPVMMAGATTTTANTRSIGNITINIQGNADQRTIDDLEARIIDLLERVA